MIEFIATILAFYSMVLVFLNFVMGFPMERIFIRFVRKLKNDV